MLVVGVAARLLERTPFKLGRLPGDLALKGKNSAFYFPLTTSILLSLLLSSLLWFFQRR